MLKVRNFTTSSRVCRQHKSKNHIELIHPLETTHCRSAQFTPAYPRLLSRKRAHQIRIFERTTLSLVFKWRDNSSLIYTTASDLTLGLQSSLAFHRLFAVAHDVLHRSPRRLCRLLLPCVHQISLKAHDGTRPRQLLGTLCEWPHRLHHTFTSPGALLQLHLGNTIRLHSTGARRRRRQ